MLRLFWLLIILWILLRGGLLWLGWVGNPDPAARQRVLTYFTPDDIVRGETYFRHGFWARAVVGYWQMAFLLLGIFSGFFAALHARCEALAGGGFWGGSLLFLVAFQALYSLAVLPFSYYLGHICEQEMGFSTMTAAQWLWRWAKGFAVSTVVQAAGVLLFLWVVRTFPRAWPVVVPSATTAYGVVLTLLFPVLVTPLFYEQKPLADGPLKERILAIAARAGVPVEGIYEIDESRYSKHTNAYFTGLGSRKRIVLYDTLIKSHTVDEAALIFAHEVGHWQHDHMAKGIALGFLGGLVGCVALWWVFPWLQAETAFRLQPLWSAANVPFFAVVTMVGNLLLAPIEAQISQHFERQADRASLDLTGLRQVFIEAEVRLARDNRSHLLPHPWRVFWLFSHPPAIERIAMAETWIPPAQPR
ncbi:MAG: Ste24 endopeptidase [Candidatus Ozemobacter sibiricus]|jgi:STE24 endopeptidase|uniref:Ste24 endopeptidase n=1 Tax=Candidatus Ozemobacter sibiricus TaxID=2268124 RepID=A0A367ZP03_9BACT|nr:MAG: Ste24 endopeptidase [Candidatus Ozemobacter sibiricus]